MRGRSRRRSSPRANTTTRSWMPSRHRFVTLDVFTPVAFGGNQLAVFPDASAIPEDALLVLGAAGAAPGGKATLVLEEGVGPVTVTVNSSGGGPPFAQLSVAKLAEVGPPAPSRGMLAEILSIDAEDILASPMAPQNVSCGLPFLLVPLRSVDAVSRSRLRLDKWETTLKSSWAPDVFLFA